MLRWRLLTPAGRPGALAAISIEADDSAQLDGWLARAHMTAAPGESPLRSLLGIDDGLVLRPGPTVAILTPHGGSEIIRQLAAKLEEHSVARAQAGPAPWPEARSEIEAHLLEALARAPSPLAIKVLIEHARRWEAAAAQPSHSQLRLNAEDAEKTETHREEPASPASEPEGLIDNSRGWSAAPDGAQRHPRKASPLNPDPEGVIEPSEPARGIRTPWRPAHVPPAHERAPSAAPIEQVPPEVATRLRRLLIPPTVAIVGPPNIGKSALLNRLARRSISTVADEPGTTRDHVGAMIDCAGLIARFLDAPGLRAGAGPIEAEAQHLARAPIAEADLLLICHDAQNAPAALDLPVPTNPTQQRLTIATRADLAPRPPAPLPWPTPPDITTSAHTGEGLDTLPRLIRDTLIPPADLTHPARWAFWA